MIVMIIQKTYQEQRTRTNNTGPEGYGWDGSRTRKSYHDHTDQPHHFSGGGGGDHRRHTSYFPSFYEEQQAKESTCRRLEGSIITTTIWKWETWKPRRSSALFKR
jgi:hypothetical protein